jgi:hypothetical protein
VKKRRREEKAVQRREGRARRGLEGKRNKEAEEAFEGDYMDLPAGRSM